MLPTSLTLRQAGPADWPAIQALLQSLGLPTAGAQQHLATFVLALSGEELLGCAGAEVYGRHALLRSVAVAPAWQGRGLGRRLLQLLLQQARAREIDSLHLLTQGASGYFTRLGFAVAPRSSAPAGLQASAEFRGACPADAVFMSLALQVPAPAMADDLPVAVLGAGPVGLAAAAQLLERGMPFVLLEAGDSVGRNLLDYGHVRLFSPWRYNIDASMARRLSASGWTAPPEDELPLAAEVVERVLRPFAALPELARALKLGARVSALSREGMDKVKSAGRERAPFVLRYQQDGREHELRARAVLDATGTWNQPNPLGANGLPARGEAEVAAQIHYGIPDIAGTQRARYAGRRTLVVGAGHSAANALLDLAALAREAPGTRLAWALRSSALHKAFGGGAADALPARGALGSALQQLSQEGGLEVLSGLRIEAVQREADGRLTVSGRNEQGQALSLAGFDQIICATGQRPDLSLGRELRLRLDPWLESTEALGPLIDPNLHSCGTVRPHGHRELAHPEPGFYTLGVKSYGRAPTFLMATGFEQARSVVAALAGDLEAADRLELALPETGVCNLGGSVSAPAAPASPATAGCCPTPASAPAPAACATSCQPAAPARSACCG
ncbi:MAG: arsenic resistance N-acetyltransferase ArsN2 [Roseateles sp.]